MLKYVNGMKDSLKIEKQRSEVSSEKPKMENPKRKVFRLNG